MAGALVGGSFLSAFLQVLFDRMASREILDFFKGRKLNDGMLKKLKTTLITVNGVLDDAEEKQITKPAVKEWLDELQHAVYEADDFLDDVDYEALQSEVEASTVTSSDRVRNFFSSLNLFKRAEFEAKLEEILESLEYLVKQMNALGLSLREGTGEKSWLQRTPTTSLADESGVYGRDHDKEAILKFLISDDANGNNLGVIPIVGIGGMGKTALAQLIYNDSRVKEWFSLKGWVCVSEEYDVSRITKDILEEISRKTCDGRNLNQLQILLRERVMGKRFLLVLDDIWNDSYSDWDLLRTPLNSGAHGSKIIVTTRNTRVASVMSTVSAHHLKALEKDQCWSLFKKHAFDNESSNTDLNLEDIGRQIVEKCKGLPLAIKVLGGLLCSTRDIDEWEKISKSNLWDLSGDNIFPALRLSYHYLPSPLKRCFAYCAVFPKDYEFEKEELVRLWMAEGFLILPKGGREMEELGNTYFQDLVSRSFLQRSHRKNPCFVMHDLINDLAKLVSGDFCIRLEGRESCKIVKQTRHLSHASRNTDASVLKDVNKAQHLRTFLSVQFSKSWWRPYKHIETEVLHDLLSTHRCLRVLSLSDFNHLRDLPHSVFNFKHLRYLDLSRTSIKSLDNLVSSLYKLETLILRECCDLTALPDSIGNLKHLQYLDLFGTLIRRLPESICNLYNLQTLILHGGEERVPALPISIKLMSYRVVWSVKPTNLEEMPPHMGNLKRLRNLTHFVLGNQGGSSIKDLKDLQHLQGELCIQNLQNVRDVREALEANLKGKKHLKKLELKWVGDADDSEHHRSVLEQLQPNTYLESLSITGYGGTRFSEWVGDSSFSNIVRLVLHNCKYCSCLPPLGQLASLEELSVEAFDGVVVIGAEFYGSRTSTETPFRSLKSLRFLDMPQWLDWTSHVAEGKDGSFPLLQKLSIIKCPNLVMALPPHLPSLTTLEIVECHWRLLDSLREAPCLQSLVADAFDSLNSILAKEADGKPRLCTILKSIEIYGSEEVNSLKCFPLEMFPKLKTLCIQRCPSLEGLVALDGSQAESNFLSSLEIQMCPNLACFPKGGLHVPLLRSLSLIRCSKLKSLPERMHSLLPSLNYLEIRACPEIESFPEGGLPSKLKTLHISNCRKLFAGRMRWDLQLLPSLSHFDIFNGEDVESFPEKTLLPSTLTSLSIGGLQNLKYLDYEGLQHLTTLTRLRISSCRGLQSLPEQGLPSSLTSLCISSCPLLEQRCQREKGEDWPKISHIPNIEINKYLI